MVNERQDGWDALLSQVEFAYNTSVSATTGLAPNEVHMSLLPRLPRNAMEHQQASGHQGLDRDHVEHCDLAADRQKRAYELEREKHALSVSRVERRHSTVSDALRKWSACAVRSWIRLYNSESVIRRGNQAVTGDKVFKTTLSLLWTAPLRIFELGPADKTPDGKPLAKKILYLGLLTDVPVYFAKLWVSVVSCSFVTHSAG